MAAIKLISGINRSKKDANPQAKMRNTRCRNVLSKDFCMEIPKPKLHKQRTTKTMPPT
ncbi:hypothetical protein AM1BK_47100 [Neobacillus kokaensis]|uniref:Uncharacterized protein n=1 Tax=Neobacillus kokaensis TaxID=2759023 RepID=A0ABQ3NB85_9BACI|nr:hypothetical protein AM1BK_47100 [Neobacillus kokaensis]